MTTLLALVWLMVGCSAELRNVAPDAEVTASTEDAADGQAAHNAVDGVADGWPADFSREWVTDRGGRGSWLELRWATPQRISQVVMFDRPNLRDGVSAATLTFDDGPPVTVGSLPNDGKELKVSFPARTTTALRFTVTEVRPGTESVGLAEIQVLASVEDSRPDSTSSSVSPTCPNGSVINVVAHADDDLLFLNPTVSHDLEAGRCVRTVVVTAGDDGGPASYWRERESGLRAAYSKLAGSSQEWGEETKEFAGHRAEVFRLADHPRVSLVFLRMPDGNLDGGGFAKTGYQSVAKLWKDDAPVTTVDQTSTYTRAGLANTLTAVIAEANATRVNTLDPRLSPTDHSDHAYVARFVEPAISSVPTPPDVRYFVGYGTADQPENVTGRALADKKAAFFAYAGHDDKVCASDAACRGLPYAAWLSREYEVPR